MRAAVDVEGLPGGGNAPLIRGRRGSAGSTRQSATPVVSHSMSSQLNSPVLVQLLPIVLQALCTISRRYGPEFPIMFSGLCQPNTDIRGSHRLGGEAFEYAHPPALSSRTWLSSRRRMSQLWRGPIFSICSFLLPARVY